MSEARNQDCPHAEGVTLMWLYGEADEGHAEHVAQCAVCTKVVEEHSEVVARLGMARASRRVDALHVPEPANRPFPRRAAGLLLVLAAGAAAAVVALVVGASWLALPDNREPPIAVQVEDPSPTPQVLPVEAGGPAVPEAPIVQREPPPRVVQGPETAPIPREHPVDLPEPRRISRAAVLAVPTQAERFDVDLGGILDDLDALEDGLTLL